MPQTKMSPCCARYAGKITAAKADLHRVAKRAAIADEKSHPMGPWRKRIDEAKITIANAEKYLTDHEAEHAAD